MPALEWFPGGGAELRRARPAARRRTSSRDPRRPTRDGAAASSPAAELRAQVAAAAARARASACAGRPRGRLLPNSPEAVVALPRHRQPRRDLVERSPDFGARRGRRFTQIEPKVLLAVDGYRYGGKDFDRPSAVVGRAGAPALATVVLRGSTSSRRPSPPPRAGRRWARTGARARAARAAVRDQVPLRATRSGFSIRSGTTGLPKAIVHGHGGILLEHLKALRAPHDLGPGDRFFWFTTTGWMMWNFLVGGCSAGGDHRTCTTATPAYPDLGTFWDARRGERVTYFGTSAAFLSVLPQGGRRARRDAATSRACAPWARPARRCRRGLPLGLRASARDLLLASVSGGTDVCTAFVGGVPTCPSIAGEINAAARRRGRGVRRERAARWSMRVGRAGHHRSVALDAGVFLGRRGRVSAPRRLLRGRTPALAPRDWIRITPRGAAVIYGRTDCRPSTAAASAWGRRRSTACRVWTSPEIADALVVDTWPLTGGPTG